MDTITYKVIADYPDSTYEIGVILVQGVPDYYTYVLYGKTIHTFIRNIDKYPHIFLKLT